MSALVNAVSNIIIGRRLSAVGLTCLFWDHILTLDVEYSLWWANTGVGRMSKFTFFANRYLTEMVMVYTAYILSGLADIPDTIPTPSCDAFVWMFGIGAIVFNGISHFVILFRIYSLWDRRKVIAWVLLGSFTANLLAIIALAVLTVQQIQQTLELDPQLNLCVLTKPLAVKLLLGLITVFDLFLTALTVYNAMEQPRRSHVEVIRSLQSTGMRFFIDELFLPFLSIVWALCSVINARLHLRLESLRLFRPPGLELIERS
ncbi:hypothetical protein BD779DRAFT_1517272 [Infundibulicybe gibba]|nr:hypothetical protein BD779DRAFT_1517272 [Infundibulicybe gibba]